MSVDTTAQRIVLAALRTLLKQGVKRSSVADVAYEAGVTRITIYRYYGDKQGLIETVCRHLADIFRRASEGNPGDSIADIDIRLKRLGEELGDLPPGNLLALFDEIRRCIRPSTMNSGRPGTVRSTGFSNRRWPWPPGKARSARGSILKS